MVGRTEDILARLAGLKEKVDEITGARKGKLIIVGSLLPGYSFLPLAVHKFSRQHPGIDVSLKVEGSSFIEKALLEGEIDIAIVSRVPQSSLLAVWNYRSVMMLRAYSPRREFLFLLGWKSVLPLAAAM